MLGERYTERENWPSVKHNLLSCLLAKTSISQPGQKGPKPFWPQLLIILNICSNTLVSGHNSSHSLPFLLEKSHSSAKGLTTMEKFCVQYSADLKRDCQHRQIHLTWDSPPKLWVAQNPSSPVSTRQYLSYRGHSPKGELPQQGILPQEEGCTNIDTTASRPALCNISTARTGWRLWQTNLRQKVIWPSPAPFFIFSALRIRKFGRKRSNMYNVCSVCGTELQWLLSLIFWVKFSSQRDRNNITTG